MHSLRGAEGLPFLDDFARLRMEVFREYPYLYEGDISDERAYLGAYLSSDFGRVFALFDGDTLAGMLTCGPMSAEPGYLKDAFEKSGLNAGESFYLGDMVLRKAYRGRGLFPRFFEAAKKQAIEGNFKTLSLMCLVNSKDDFGRPENFRDVVGLCEKIGFSKLAGAELVLDWPSVALGGAQKMHTLQLFAMNLR